MALREDVRHTLCGILETLASSRLLVEYATECPMDVVAELYSQWFDDFYHPDSAMFRSMFSAGELERMRDVNLHLESAEAMIRGKVIAEVLKAPAWHSVQAAACSAIKEMKRGTA